MTVVVDMHHKLPDSAILAIHAFLFKGAVLVYLVPPGKTDFDARMWPQVPKRFSILDCSSIGEGLREMVNNVNEFIRRGMRGTEAKPFTKLRETVGITTDRQTQDVFASYGVVPVRD